MSITPTIAFALACGIAIAGYTTIAQAVWTLLNKISTEVGEYRGESGRKFDELGAQVCELEGRLDNLTDTLTAHQGATELWCDSTDMKITGLSERLTTLEEFVRREESRERTREEVLHNWQTLPRDAEGNPVSRVHDPQDQIDALRDRIHSMESY